MDSIENKRVIEDCNEVIVELQGIDEHGTIDVVSYLFASEDDGRALAPKGPVDDGQASVVRETLEGAGFEEGLRSVHGAD